MNKVIIILILLTIHIFTFASVIDSLNAALNELNVDKGDINIQLSEEYINISPDSSIEFAKSAFKHAKSDQDKVDFLNQLGISYEYSGRYLEALLEYNKALQIAESNQYSEGIGLSLMNIAIAKTQLADYESALDFALRAKKIYEVEDESEHLTTVLNNLGNIYLKMKNIQKSLDYYNIALRKEQKKGNEAVVASIYQNIALVYIELEEWDRALDFLERSLIRMKRIDDEYGKAFCYNNLSNIFNIKEDYEKSVDYNFMALAIFEEIESPEGIANTCYLLGSTFMLMERHDQAFDQFKRSLGLAKEIDLENLISKNYQAFSMYYAAIGDYKQAFTYLELHKVKNDSIFSEEKSNKIAYLQNKYNEENSENTISKLQKDKVFQTDVTRILILGIIFGTMVLAFLFFLFREKISEISIRKETEDKLLESERTFRQLTENISIAVFTFDIEGKFTYVNLTTTIITGYSKKELLSMKFFDIAHPEHRESVMSKGFDCIKGEGVIQKYDFMIITKQGKTKRIEVYNSRTTIDGLIVVLGTATDITERWNTDNRIRESEEKYKYLIESIEEGLIIKDEFEEISFTNNAAREIFGYTEKEMNTMNFQKLVSAEDFCRLQLETDKRIKGESSKYELEVICKNGEKRLILITDSPIFENDTFVNTIAIFVDVTDIRKAEIRIESQLHEKEVMLQEIYHRVKNNLQIISSMLKLQAAYVDDDYSKQMFSNCQHRVKSMSLVHEKLYRSDNLSKISFKDYTESLIKNLFASLNINSNRIKFELDINNVNLNISVAIPCGLIINELITNALKYGFPDDRHGIIKISFNKLDNQKLKLTVWNNGVDLPEKFDMNNLDSFGMKLVDILKHQLEAELIIERDKGVAFSLIFALKD